MNNQKLKKENKTSSYEVKDYYLWEKLTSTITPLDRNKREKTRHKTQHKLQHKLQTEIAREKPDLQNLSSAKTKKTRFTTPSYLPVNNKNRARSTNIEPNLHKRLKRGAISIEAKLDLHGLRQNEAYNALCNFINDCYSKNYRTILIITGKGMGGNNLEYQNMGNRGILRKMLPIWLESANFSTMISGWQISARKHGGDGAYYVRLKKGGGTK